MNVQTVKWNCETFSQWEEKHFFLWCFTSIADSHTLTIFLINATLIHVYLWAQHWVLSVCYILLIIYNCLVSAGAARKLSRLNGDPFFNSGPNDKKDDQHHPEQRLASTSHSLPRPSLVDHGLFLLMWTSSTLLTVKYVDTGRNQSISEDVT